MLPAPTRALICCQNLLQALVMLAHGRFDITCVILTISEEAVLLGLVDVPLIHVPDVVVPGNAVRAA